MTIAPFRKLIAEIIKMNDMLPLEPARLPRFPSGNVAVVVNHMFALGVLGSAIKGDLVGAVNFPHQDPFRLADRMNFAVAFLAGINGQCEQAD